MNIQYRPASADDFARVVDIFVTNMNVAIFTAVTDQTALRDMAIMFLAKDFQNADYLQVAECNDTLCGVLIGTTDRASHKAVDLDAEPLVKHAHEALTQSVAGRRNGRAVFGEFPHGLEHDAAMLTVGV